MKQRTTLRSEAVVAGLILAAFAAISPTLFGAVWGLWLLAALVVGMVVAALLRPAAPTLAPEGVRFVHRLLFDKQLPYDAIARTRIRPSGLSGQPELVFLGEGGARLGALPIGRSQHLVEELLRALGPRRVPVSLEDLARPAGATVAEWKAKLDSRAQRVRDPTYRASPEAEIIGLEAAIIDGSNALDVRAGAAYVLVQSGTDSALAAARRALPHAPPLALAMARAAKGGQALVSEESAHDALATIGGEDATALSTARAEQVDDPEDDGDQAERHHD